MKKTLKKGLAYLLAVSMIITFIPMAAFGAETPANAGSANDTVSLSATAEDGMTVFITAAPGVLPEGATVTASVVQDAQPVKELIEGQTDVGSMAAYDVTIRDPQGNEIQPDGTVGVTFRNANVAGDAKVFHVEGEAEAPKAATELETILNNESLQSFTTDGFSIYVVVGTGEDARLLVHFKSGTDNVASIYVKKDDNMEQVVYDPGVGELDEGVYFRGWTTDENYTTKTTPMTIAQVRTDLEDKLPPAKDGDEVTYYAMLFKSYTITYYDEYGISLGQQEVSFRADSTDTSQSYTVNMGYTVQDTEHNFEGWKVNKGGNNIDGWESSDNDGQGTFYENETPITISGNVEFGVNAPAGHWLVFNENGKGATYNAPKFIYTDVVTEKPCDDEAMTRYGYTFTGWYTDADCTSEFQFGNKINDYTTVYAGWEANANANYTVIIWKQRSSDAVDATNANKNYDFAEAITGTGTVGTAIDGVTQNGSNVNTGTTPAQTRNIRVNGTEKAYTGFHCARYDQNVTITAEGTAVLNVYYDRNVITITFNAGDYGYSTVLDENDGTYKNVVTYTGLYEAPLNFKWPSTYRDWRGESNDTLWQYGGGTTLSFIGSFKLPNPANVTLNMTREGGGSHPRRFIQQNTDGTWPTEAHDTINMTGRNFTITDKYTGFNAVQYRRHTSSDTSTTGFENWVSLGSPDANGDYVTVQNANQLEIRFARIKEPITYLNGVYFSGNSGEVVEESSHGELYQTEPIYYDADITDYGEKGNEKYYIPEAPAGYDDYVFEGWYADENCTTPYVWSTMPAEGVTVYAKWRQIQYRVFLHPNKPEGATSDIDWGTSQEMNFRVSSGGTISEPTGRLNGYEFVGWYKDVECTQAFNGDAFVLNETNVTSEYNNSQSDYQSTDANRFWITKRFDIYAKWRATLEGAQGIGISYDLNGGTGTAGDTNTYVDGAWAPAAAAVTAPEGKQFGYWIVQTWDAEQNKYVDDETSATVFPGDTFQVLKKDAKVEDISNPEVGKDTKKYTVKLKAVYIDSEEPTPTFITWFNNDGTEGYTNEGVTSLAINESVPIVEAPTRDGYTFLGWSIFSEPLDYDTYATREEALAAAVEWEAEENNWTQTLSETDLDIIYNSETGEYNAAEVAANEDTPYHAMFAVYKEDEVTINYAVAEGQSSMGSVSKSTETIKAITDSAEGSTAKASSSTYAFDYWTMDKGTDPVSRDATFVPTKNDSGVYEAHTYYAHFKLNEATVTVHHYLKGTTTKVADDATETKTIGEKYTATPVSAYQEKTLTVDTEASNDYTDVDVVAGGVEITIYYTLPLTITAASDKKVYDGNELTNNGYTSGDNQLLSGDEITSVTVAGSQTLVGSSDNVPSNAKVVNGKTETSAGTEVEYYIIQYVNGTLEVTDGTDPEEQDVDPNLVVTKADANASPDSENPVKYVLGRTVTFAITATNIYDEAKIITLKEIEGVTLAQSSFNDVAAGETISTTATYTITEADILNNAFTNTVTAAVGALTKTASATVKTEDPNGHLTVTKTTTSETPEGGYKLGDTIKYQITVKNDGNLTIKDITVNDALTGDTWTIASLAPNTTSDPFTATYVVKEKDILAGKVVNVATATGTSPDPDNPDVPVKPGEDPEPTEDLDTTLTVEKTITNKPADDEAFKLGESIQYIITVKNEGNVPYTNVVVEDELTSKTWTIASLAVGKTEEFETSYTVTEADILKGSVTNTATAKANPIVDPKDPDNPKQPKGEGEVTTGTDPVDPNPPIEGPNGHLTVAKTTTSNPANSNGYREGETINYQIVVTNDGNLTITDITVTDAKTGDTWEIASLAPGASETFTTSYTVTSADVTAGSVLNVATATGASPDPDEPDVPVEPGEREDKTGTTPPTPVPDPYIPDEPIPLDLTTDHYAYVEGYEDGMVKPDGSITRAETATMIYRLLTMDRRDEIFTDQNNYSDVDVAAWYNKAVSSMTNGEYVNGYPDGTFKANRTITRAEFVTILVRFLEGQRNGENPFSDVSGHWAEDYIVTAVQAGWIDGYPDGTFRPNEAISRAEAMKIMNSVLHRGVNEESELGDYINFPDNSDPSKWYYFEIIEAVNSHEAENERPDENWIANECEFHYDIDKYERPGV